ncbi:hypothetical protein, partial [Flavobacterium sp. U410]
SGGGNTGGTPGDEDYDDGLVDPKTCKGCGGVVTVPVPELEQVEVTITPCSELQKILNTPYLLQAINSLETYTNATKEWGYAIKTFPNSTTTEPPHIIESDSEDPNKIKMGDYIGGDYYGAYHTHPKPSTGVVPMFSHGDVKWLFDVAKKHSKSPKTQQDYHVYFLTLTCVYGTYAIKIKDWVKFSIFISNGYGNFYKELEKKYEKINGSEAGSTTLEKTFLSLMKEYDMGMGLYELNPDKIGWNELTLNEDPATFYKPVKETPCNE